MSAKPSRYPTAQELRNLSNQELFERRLLGLASGSFGGEDPRPNNGRT